MSQGINKIAAERNQRTLLELASQPGNDVCADCKARHPRWASHSLGIFICVNCASIHRKMGTHISKVKSLTLDSWSKEQVEVMKSTGNIKSNDRFNPDEVRHPPPMSMIDQERDSELEKYIRYKYEYKKFMARSSKVAELLGPSRSASSRIASGPSRSQTMPPSAPSAPSSQPSTTPSLPASNPTFTSATVDNLRSQSQIRSISQPVSTPAAPAQVQPQVQVRPATQPSHQQSSNPLWNDLAQLQTPAANSSLPLQYASPVSTLPMSLPSLPTSGLSVPSNQFSGLSASSNTSYPSPLAQQQPTGMFPGGAHRSMSLNTGMGMSTGMGLGMGGGFTPGMPGTSPSMFHPQPMTGGLTTPNTLLPQNTTPSPNPFTPQALPPAGLGIQQSFASSYGQPNQLMPPQGSPMIPAQPMPQGSPMFPSQPLGQMQSSPMFQSPALGQQMQMQMQPPQMGKPFMQMQGQPQPQQNMTPFGTPQMPFGGAPAQQMQMQQPMFGQQQNMNAFGGTGWQQQQTGFPGQQWGGM